MTGDGLRSTQAWIVTVAAAQGRAVGFRASPSRSTTCYPSTSTTQTSRRSRKLTIGVFAFIGLHDVDVAAITQSDNPSSPRSRA